LGTVEAAREMPAEMATLLACCRARFLIRVLVAFESSNPASSSLEMSLGPGTFTVGVSAAGVAEFDFAAGMAELWCGAAGAVLDAAGAPDPRSFWARSFESSASCRLWRARIDCATSALGAIMGSLGAGTAESWGVLALTRRRGPDMMQGVVVKWWLITQRNDFGFAERNYRVQDPREVVPLGKSEGA
jgi:hypothetical protein